jgi:hypothetical protein
MINVSLDLFWSDAAMFARLRQRSTVEHPLRYDEVCIIDSLVFGCRRISGAKVEIGPTTMVWNFTPATNVLGTTRLTNALDHA